jgi:hypothetical protein
LVLWGRGTGFSSKEHQIVATLGSIRAWTYEPGSRAWKVAFEDGGKTRTGTFGSLSLGTRDDDGLSARPRLDIAQGDSLQDARERYLQALHDLRMMNVMLVAPQVAPERSFELHQVSALRVGPEPGSWTVTAKGQEVVVRDLALRAFGSVAARLDEDDGTGGWFADFKHPERLTVTLQPDDTLSSMRDKAARLLGLSSLGRADGRPAPTVNMRPPAPAPARPASPTASTPRATPMLDRFGTDLTALAALGALDPMIGRRKELRKVIKTLSKRLRLWHHASDRRSAAGQDQPEAGQAENRGRAKPAGARAHRRGGPRSGIQRTAAAALLREAG